MKKLLKLISLICKITDIRRMWASLGRQFAVKERSLYNFIAFSRKRQPCVYHTNKAIKMPF